MQQSGVGWTHFPLHDLEITMRYPLLVPIAVGALLAACAKAPSDPTGRPAAKPSIIAAIPPSTATAAPSSAATESDSALLYQRANQAEREGRIVSPEGDNAFELLLTLRETAPDNASYRNALFDLMPLADRAIRHALQQNDLAEAERLTAMVSRFDASSNVSVSARERLNEAMSNAAKSAAQQAARAATASAMPPPVPSVAPVPSPLASTPSSNPPPARDTAVGAIAGTKPAMQSAVVAAAQAGVAPAPSLPPAQKRVQPEAPSRNESTRPNPTSATSPETGQSSPVALRRAPAQYPEQAKRQGVEGFVELDVLVDAAGNPSDIKVVRSQPSGLFDRAAIRAMMRWKFQPAMRDGQAVPARTRTVMQFKKS